MRGALVGIYQNNVCVGIVLAQLINYFVQNMKPDKLKKNTSTNP